MSAILAHGPAAALSFSGRVLSNIPMGMYSHPSRPFPEGPFGKGGLNSDPLGSRAVSLNDDVIF